MMKRFWIWFVLVWLAAVKNLSAADVTVDAVVKVQHFLQYTAGTPVQPSTNGFSFQAFVLASTNDVVTGAVVTLPNISTRILTNESPVDWRFEEKFDSAAAMDAAYPHISFSQYYTYQMQMQTVNDGPRANNCSYAPSILGLGIYPATPQISNWTAAQQIDHTRAFTLQWNNLGNNANDVVQLLVEQNVTNVYYTSPKPFTTNALTGASTSVTIPGYSLPPGTDLTAHLLIVHVAGIPDTNNYAAGVAALGKETTFPVATRPAPASPSLTLVSRTNNQTRLLLTGETNRSHQIQATVDWTNWQTLITTNPTSGTFSFNDVTNLTRRYYRGRVGD
jgi:hypothetical protein